MSESLITKEEAELFLNVVRLGAGEGKTFGGTNVQGFRFSPQIPHPHSMMFALYKLAFPQADYPNIGLTVEPSGNNFIYLTRNTDVDALVNAAKEVSADRLVAAVNKLFVAQNHAQGTKPAPVFAAAQTTQAASVTI